MAEEAKTREETAREPEYGHTMVDLQEAMRRVTEIYVDSPVLLESYVGMLELLKQSAIHDAMKRIEADEAIGHLREMLEDVFETREMDDE